MAVGPSLEDYFFIVLQPLRDLWLHHAVAIAMHCCEVSLSVRSARRGAWNTLLLLFGHMLPSAVAWPSELVKSHMLPSAMRVVSKSGPEGYRGDSYSTGHWTVSASKAFRTLLLEHCVVGRPALLRCFYVIDSGDIYA